jgi:hypothetical protein
MSTAVRRRRRHRTRRPALSTLLSRRRPPASPCSPGAEVASVHDHVRAKFAHYPSVVLVLGPNTLGLRGLESS